MTPKLGSGEPALLVASAGGAATDPSAHCRCCGQANMPVPLASGVEAHALVLDEVLEGLGPEADAPPGTAVFSPAAWQVCANTPVCSSQLCVGLARQGRACGSAVATNTKFRRRGVRPWRHSIGHVNPPPRRMRGASCCTARNVSSAAGAVAAVAAGVARAQRLHSVRSLTSSQRSTKLAHRHQQAGQQQLWRQK
jgi:hypothetical protein